MQTIQIIEYRRTRDFSRKMNATFEFIRQNFKGLGKSILFISGPPILMASVLMASFFGDMTNIVSAFGNASTGVSGGLPGRGKGRGVPPVVAHPLASAATTISRTRMGSVRIIG